MRLNPILTQKLIKTLLWVLTGLTIGILFFIVIFIFIKGLPQISWAFLSTNPVDMGRSGGILATIVSTIYLIGIALFFATPLGLGTAIYLTEYTREGLITRIIRFGTESLAGIPSIILGLFGFAIFVMALGWGWSLLSGGLTLSAMLLPTIIRTSEESILAVPQEFREVSFSLGSGQMADYHPRGPAHGPPGNHDRYRPEHCPFHWRNGGHYLYRRFFPAVSRIHL